MRAVVATDFKATIGQTLYGSFDPSAARLFDRQTERSVKPA